MPTNDPITEEIYNRSCKIIKWLLTKSSGKMCGAYFLIQLYELLSIIIFYNRKEFNKNISKVIPKNIMEYVDEEYLNVIRYISNLRNNLSHCMYKLGEPLSSNKKDTIDYSHRILSINIFKMLKLAEIEITPEIRNTVTHQLANLDNFMQEINKLLLDTNPPNNTVDNNLNNTFKTINF